MTEYARVTVHDETNVMDQHRHNIPFRPDRPGRIAIASVVPMPHTSKLQSATGFLCRLELYRPGKSKPVMKVNLPISDVQKSDPSLALTYEATAADLSYPGHWTCQLSNDTFVDLVFSTDISYVSNYPLQIASFDIGLLNLLLAEAVSVAGLKLHLQTSGKGENPASYVTWSRAVALATGLISYPFPQPNVDVDLDLIDLPDYERPIADHYLPGTLTFRIILDSLPISGLSLDPNMGALRTTIEIDPSTAKIECLNSNKVDVRVESIQIEIAVGLNGIIQAGCSAKVKASFVVNVSDFDVDLSDFDVSDAVASAFVNALARENKVAGKFPPRLVRQHIDDFFVRLMRLDNMPPPTWHRPEPFWAYAHIESYVPEGQQLKVRFYSVPQQLSIQSTDVLVK